MLNKRVFIISYFLLGFVLCASVSAHEYWLQPEQFRLQFSETIKAHIRVGQHFSGDSYAYIPNDVESVQIHLGKKSRSAGQRFGNIPAISYKPLGEGLNILALASLPSQVTYSDPAKFKKFLSKEGIEWVLKEHNKRGLPDSGFNEAFRRNAKSLIKVGNGSGDDRKVGLEFEWVMQTNPYTTTDDELSAQLWWHGKVFAKSHFRVFILKDSRVTEKSYKTDANGVGHFPRIPGAIYMINAVHMVVPDQEVADDLDVVWESLWASITFATSSK